MDSVQDKVEEVEIPQKHIEALERINAITVMDRLTYNVHKQSRNTEEVWYLFVHTIVCVKVTLYGTYITYNMED